MTATIDTGTVNATIANNATGIAAASAASTAALGDFVTQNALIIGITISAMSFVLAAVFHILNWRINKKNAELNRILFLTSEAQSFLKRVNRSGMTEAQVEDLEQQLKESIAERRN